MAARLTSDRSLLLGLVVLLNVIGAVMVLSASSVESILQYGSPWSVFEHQLLWIAIGSVAFVAMVRVDYHRWQKYTIPLLVVSIALLVLVLVPGFGVNADGSSRWVGTGPIKLQPSELAKLALVVFAADLLARRGDRIEDWRACIRPLAIVLGLMGLLVLKQPDMGTTMILVVIALGMLFLARVPLRHLVVTGASVVLAAIVIGLAEPYRRERLTSFLHPFSQRSDAGYQVVQSLSALGSGHILGVGLGAGRAKWGFLPNAYTDFIFTVIGEELGVIGALVVVALFAVLALVGIRIARRAPDRFGALLVGGVTCWVVGQAVFNMGTVVGLLPVTGVPLPFISYGGSSLVIIMAAMGVVMNVAASSRGRIAGTQSAGAIGGRRRRRTSSTRPAHVGRYYRRAGVTERHRIDHR